MKIPLIVILRDVILFSCCVYLWIELDLSSLSILSSILLSFYTTLVAFFVHEWGHWFGAQLVSAKLEIKNSILSFFLFKFDKSNSFRQYTIMSLGGFLSSALMVVLIFWFSDSSTYAGAITQILVTLGVLVTLFIEVPELIRTLRRKKYPNGFAYIDNA